MKLGHKSKSAEGSKAILDTTKESIYIDAVKKAKKSCNSINKPQRQKQAHTKMQTCGTCSSLTGGHH